jgi:hypothetical protein
MTRRITHKQRVAPCARSLRVRVALGMNAWG